MSRFNFVRRCHNCGALLQGDDPAAPGYIDPQVLGNLEARVLFCNHCFEESRYNFSPKDPKGDEGIAEMLRDAEASDALIVYVIDLFSFENSFVPDIIPIIANCPLLIVANKRDLLPSGASDEELREYVAHRFRVASLSCTSDDVMLVSLRSDSGCDGIWEMIQQRRKAHDVYVIGASQCGKTQLISALLHSYTNPTGEQIGYITYPGTSLQVMQIPLDRSSYLYDTPGTSLSNSVLTKVGPKEKNMVIPTKEVEGERYVLSEGDALFLGGLARIEYIRGPRCPVRVYVSPKVDVVKTGVDDAETLFFRKVRREIIAPIAERGWAPADFDAYELDITEQGVRDIGIAGLGWFSFEGQGQTFRIYVLKGVGVYASRAKVKSHAAKRR